MPTVNQLIRKPRKRPIARNKIGECVQIDEYRERFPAHFDTIRQSVADDRAPEGEPRQALEPGDIVDDFEIIRLIDEGSHGQSE